MWPTDINNNGNILFTLEKDGIFKTKVFGTYRLFIVNDLASDKKHEIIASEKPYYSVGLNARGVVIAHEKKSKEGFYGSKEHEMISLKSFKQQEPNCWQKGKDIFIRLEDGSFIDLNKVIDSSSLKIEKIVEIFAINDQGQILVSAKINGQSHAFLLEPK